ncbi:unnamed protein product [Callosobruchus maculatus]|uniref:Uncharacterized protein n=1 Tax=Callosobruchus maculatus TaxID=64391 RepID=A0A653BNT1_CALMS|nr:unnamed protein product [Callosobruchus maculatus]
MIIVLSTYDHNLGPVVVNAKTVLHCVVVRCLIELLVLPEKQQ